jgi:protoporphyrinogen oxidase
MKVPAEVMIIGGGPAGLTAAYMLQKMNAKTRPIVLEASKLVGGIARTESYKGYRFDIGGHRFFTKVKPVEKLWREICGDDFVTRPRMSRIYYRGKYYNYPLKPLNALANLGPKETVHIVLSYLRWQIWPHSEEVNLEQWVTNRFGGRLFYHFFKTYTEKVWGIPCTEIRADWAAQRIKNNSLKKTIWNALTGANDTSSLIEQFEYPRLGPGQMWEKCADLVVKNGGNVCLDSRVTRIHREGNRIVAVEVKSVGSDVSRIETEHVISTMDLETLVSAIEPAPPLTVRQAAGKLKYRDFLIVTLILDHADPFPDNWIYVHSPDVNVGRIQNFRAWSPDMCPDPARSSIGMEFFCNVGDDLWGMDNQALIKLASRELQTLGLADASTVVDGTVIRQPKAYPVYDADYQDAVKTIADWVGTLENFQTVGRNGMHRYNNQDHSMLTAILAAENLFGAKHDLWNVNVERSYHEEFVVEKRKPVLAEA